MPDLYETGSPLWWLRRLSQKLTERRPQLQKWDDYYEGKHPLVFATAKYQGAFGGLFSEFADNWCEKVVTSKTERLSIGGVRIGAEKEYDADAWRMWQANELDSDSGLCHTEVYVNGVGYVIVWAGDDVTPSITVEDPQQVIVAYEAGSRRKRAAALKQWVDDDGYVLATLYLPDWVYKYRSGSKTDSQLVVPDSLWVTTGGWQERRVPGEEWPLPNPLGLVPVVEFQNDPRVRLGGRSEVRKVQPLQDAINKLVTDLLVASEFGAFRQRWATGIEIPKDPDTGKPVEAFKSAVDRFWAVRNENARFGEFSETNLANIVGAVEMVIRHLAAQTSTPPHYLLGELVNLSGDALKVAETGLVSAIRRQMPHLAERWEEVIRLGFLVLDDPRGKILDSEIRWNDPEYRTDGERVDALVKMAALGVPREVLWEKWEASPQEIARWRAMAMQEQLEASLFAPAVEPAETVA